MPSAAVVGAQPRAAGERARRGARPVLAPPASAQAAIHKCASATGAIVYQGHACGPTATAIETDAFPPLSVVPPPPRTSLERAPPAPKPPRVERVRRAEPARGDPAERRHLRAGMSEGEVIARIGPPDLTTGKGRRQSRWTWMPSSGDPETITSVLFDLGRVVEVERTVVKR